MKWIQRAVGEGWTSLEQPIIDSLPGVSLVRWLSPLQNDEYAEYRDRSFLERLSLAELAPSLAKFWPSRGPQWDALGETDQGHKLLVEAKAHIAEFCSPPSKASPRSLELIQRSLSWLATELGMPEVAAIGWHQQFYQYTNRLAHLAWLRSHGIDAYLVMVGFTGDSEMPGTTTPEAWHAAYQVADFALGLPSRHRLAPYVIHVYPEVTAVTTNPPPAPPP